MKKILSVLLFLSVLSGVFALSMEEIISYECCFPELSHVAFGSAVLDQRLGDKVSAGISFGGGYSSRLYQEESSKALVYGPAIKMGLHASYRFDAFDLRLTAGAKAIYSQFPIVLWFSSDLSLLYPLSAHTRLVFSCGVLQWEKTASRCVGLGLEVGR